MFTTSLKVSVREIEILDLISYAYTTSEIADILYLSPHTIDTHRKNLLLKLNAKNTAGLVRIGFEQGFLSLNQPLIINS